MSKRRIIRAGLALLMATVWLAALGATPLDASSRCVGGAHRLSVNGVSNKGGAAYCVQGRGSIRVKVTCFRPYPYSTYTAYGSYVYSDSSKPRHTQVSIATCGSGYYATSARYQIAPV